jgi:hypothetical protein
MGNILCLVLLRVVDVCICLLDLSISSVIPIFFVYPIINPLWSHIVHALLRCPITFKAHSVQ